MLQVLSNVKTGELALDTVPPPVMGTGMVQIRTAASLLSAGTERMLIDLASKSYLGKAQARPDLVKQVLDKVRKEGVLNTYHNVMSKMERPLPLGYSAAGTVEAVGSDVTGFSVGDRVAMAGAGYANHAEVCCVPQNLVAAIPEGVTFSDASYTTVASIALQGVRQTQPELGDNVVVIGLGLIGLITVQLLRANGCRVFGIDLDADKVELAKTLGADGATSARGADAIAEADRFTGGRGADHVLITASTKANGPIELAGELCRRKGQVVVVGAVGMDIPRDLYYKKEVDIKISMSYGPGRYDATYEEGGIDYPYDYVRWTEQRNMEAVLDLVARGTLDVATLTTHRYKFEDAMTAYDLVQNGGEPYVGLVLEYDVDKAQENVVEVAAGGAHMPTGALGVGFVGAGNYAALHLIPHVQKDPASSLVGLVTATGLNAKQKAAKFGFGYCATDLDALLGDERVDTVFIGTRHSTHASFSERALAAGKHVFVEKPVVVTLEQLDSLETAYAAANESRATGLMVGLNRRFAPMTGELKAAFSGAGVKQMIYRVNSGHIPTSSWLHEDAEGGGMLVGEACHFIDLMQYIAGETPVGVFAQTLSVGRADVADTDNVMVSIRFSGGSVGTLAYNTVGDKSAPKERLEIYGQGSVGVLDDFRRLELTQNGKRSTQKAANQDKGQRAQVAATLAGFRERGQAPIPFGQIVADMRAVFAAQRSIATGESVQLSAL